MKKLVSLLAALFILGCVTIPKPSEILNCEQPKGKRYVCYSNEECAEYMAGYSAVLGMKAAKPEDSYGWGQSEDRPIVYWNLFAAHSGLLMLGKMEGEKLDGKLYIRFWLAVYDSDCNLLKEDYSEGFRKEKTYEYEDKLGLEE